MALSDLTLGVFADDPFAALDATITPSTHPNPRARLRHWITQRLKAAALLPDKVQMNRPTPNLLRSSPVVLVYLLSEEPPGEPFILEPRTYEHPFTLGVQTIVARAGLPDGVTIDDVNDAFAFACHSVLLCDRGSNGLFFGGEATKCEPGRTMFDLENDGERVYQGMLMEFEISYQTSPGRPALGPLEVIHAEWDIAPTDGHIDAVDEVYVGEDES